MIEGKKSMRTSKSTCNIFQELAALEFKIFKLEENLEVGTMDESRRVRIRREIRGKKALINLYVQMQ